MDYERFIERRAEMTTLVFVYDNGQQMVLTAPGCNTLAFALNEARKAMPENATKFRIAHNQNYVSGWVQ